jgi:hypothetical protein
MTQNETILKHLRKKTITPIEAAKRYDIMCLAERIRDLRRNGHEILTTKVKQNGKQFARYSLIKRK